MSPLTQKPDLLSPDKYIYIQESDPLRLPRTQLLTEVAGSLRYEMDAEHTFEFVEGTVPAPLAQEMKAFYPDTGSYFNYFELDDAESGREALEQLHMYLTTEGSYDGVMAYSHGANLVATYIAQQALSYPSKQPPFKCAIFISGVRPADPAALERGELRLLDSTYDGVRLHLPTAHIWGVNDTLYAGSSEHLSNLCDAGSKSVFVHKEGHNVPTGRSREVLLGASKVIRRTIDRALSAQ